MSKKAIRYERVPPSGGLQLCTVSGGMTAKSPGDKTQVSFLTVITALPSVTAPTQNSL
ncbi:hypothetical protein GMPD_42560 [Geomonas paludis]|uniref:Uncharacterized protein n=1 Tax=Geomonas paludis TaxID=2740185 RepID=A0A6V8N3A3_9BACT|nr:hypothetical protein GMPD_42560 [Geomonas paludis]